MEGVHKILYGRCTQDIVQRPYLSTVYTKYCIEVISMGVHRKLYGGDKRGVHKILYRGEKK